jgi:hypothetical protein
MLEDIGWIFLYIVGFDINDLFVKKHVKTKMKLTIYYMILATIGTLLIIYNK